MQCVRDQKDWSQKRDHKAIKTKGCNSVKPEDNVHSRAVHIFTLKYARFDDLPPRIKKILKMTYEHGDY